MQFDDLIAHANELELLGALEDMYALAVKDIRNGAVIDADVARALNFARQQIHDAKVKLGVL